MGSKLRCPSALWVALKNVTYLCSQTLNHKGLHNDVVSTVTWTDEQENACIYCRHPWIAHANDDWTHCATLKRGEDCGCTDVALIPTQIEETPLPLTNAGENMIKAALSEPVHPSQLPDDPVNHPSHYTSHPSGVECIQITEHMNFNLGNALKYIWRCDEKNGTQDLEKAKWYIEREIARLKKTQ